MGNLGLTLQRRGRWRLALPHLERARALAPADVRAWFALRTTLLLLGRVEDALQDFLRFEPGAPLSAELVTSGLIFSRFLPDPAYEARYLPRALDWAYRPDQAELAAVTLSRAQYCDLPRDSLRRIVPCGLYPTAARSAAADQIAPELSPASATAVPAATRGPFR